MKRKKLLKKLLWAFAAAFVLINVVAFFHAYKFTHFTNENVTKTKDARKLSFGDKLKTVFLGINNPRPTNNILPSQQYESIKLKSNKLIECWRIKTDSSKGTVIIFHGYGGNKSS
ncbi:MAG TPA: hypothetical protein VGD26_07280, partial [Chitinophagaceae bacterium]